MGTSSGRGGFSGHSFGGALVETTSLSIGDPTSGVTRRGGGAV